jgi:predicted lipoprotein with Yx(FWY)xxD motif
MNAPELPLPSLAATWRRRALGECARRNTVGRNVFEHLTRVIVGTLSREPQRSNVTRQADSQRGARIFSRGLVIATLVGALALAGIATTVAAAHSRGGSTVLTAYKGKRGYQLVLEQNGQSLALYNFSTDANTPGKSNCYGSCQKTWYPLIKHGNLSVKQSSSSAAKINTKQLKTITRKDGSIQIEYYGQPLYRCHKNLKTGQIYGADAYQFGGSWGVMGTNGSSLPPAGYGGGKKVPPC